MAQNDPSSNRADGAPKTIPEVWDLTLLYPTPEAWENDFQQLEGKLPQLAAYAGTLGDSASSLADAFESNSHFARTLVRLWSYASNSSSEDLANAEARARQSRMRSLFSRYRTATAYMDPEILGVGKERVSSFLASEPRLHNFAFSLEQLFDLQPHTLTALGERIMGSAAQFSGTPNSAYSVMTNSEIDWPTLTLSTGENVRLDNQGYTRHRASLEREDRQRVFDTFWPVYNQFKGTFGELLAGHIQAQIWQAQNRNYPGALAMNLIAEDLPETIYTNLIEQTNAHLDVLHRYFRLRAKMLNVSDLRYFDIYPPLVRTERRYPLQESVERTLAAAAPLGPEYTGLLSAGLYGPYMHVYPRPGKRSGAYMSGAAYDVHPFILLNHQDDYNSMSTLAHEWGHAMHTVLTKKNQPFENSNYSTFIAETAAITNELLLFEHSLQGAQSDDERLFYLGEALEQMRGTFFRQAMFAEFEYALYTAAERHEALTGEHMTALYADLLRRYHGHDQGVLTIDETYAVEWAFIPHFYMNFYVYQYATSIAAASFFTEQILQGGSAERERYLDVLRAGGSQYPHQIFLAAGLDMTSPAPYEALMRRMNRIMDEIENILPN